MTSTHRILCATGAMMLSGSALASQLPPYGLTPSWPAGYIASGQHFHSGSPFADQVYLRSGSGSNPSSVQWSLAGLVPTQSVPDYGTVHVLGSINGSPAGLKLTIDAHSTSNSNVPTFHFQGTETGSPALAPSGQWFGLGLSLIAGNNGKLGSLFRYGGVEVVGYYFKDSDIISSSLAGDDVPEYRRNGFGLNQDPTAYLRALDYGIGFVSYEDPNLPAGMFGDPDFYYFSVDQAFISTWGSTNGFAYHNSILEPPHKGDIYFRHWNSGSNTWDDPEVYVTREQLGLGPEGDIDALLINDNGGNIIFSVNTSEGLTDVFSSAIPTTERSQLMVARFNGGTSSSAVNGPVKLRDSDGVPVAEKVKIVDIGDGDDDEVTALCGIDPDGPTSDARIGLPVAGGAPGAMGLSLARGAWEDPTGAPGSHLSVTVTGWGGLTPGNGLVALYKRNKGASSWGRAIGVENLRASGGSAIPITSFTLKADAFTGPGQIVEYMARLSLTSGNQWTQSDIMQIIE